MSPFLRRMKFKSKNVIKSFVYVYNVLLPLKTAFSKFFRDHCPAYAAALTYASLLSLVPIATISFSLIGYAKLSPSKIRAFLLNYFLPESNLVPIIERNMEKFIQNTTTLSIISSIALVIISFMVLSVIEAIFNHIWHVHRRRSLLNKLTSFWTVLTLTPLFFGVSLSFIAYLQHLTLSPIIISLFLSTSGFFILYRLFPYTEVSLKAAIIGALVASVLFELSKWGFRYYVKYYANFERIYGALSVIPIFLVWLYWTWNIILFGAEIAFVQDYPYFADKREQLFNPLWPVLFLLCLWQNFCYEEKRLTSRDLAKKLNLPLDKIAFFIHHFEKKGIIAETERGEILPNIPLENLYLKEILNFPASLLDELPSFNSKLEALAQRLRNCLGKEWGNIPLGALLDEEGSHPCS